MKTAMNRVDAIAAQPRLVFEHLIDLLLPRHVRHAAQPRLPAAETEIAAAGAALVRQIQLSALHWLALPTH